MPMVSLFRRASGIFTASWVCSMVEDMCGLEMDQTWPRRSALRVASVGFSVGQEPRQALRGSLNKGLKQAELTWGSSRCTHLISFMEKYFCAWVEGMGDPKTTSTGVPRLCPLTCRQRGRVVATAPMTLWKYTLKTPVTYQ